MNIYFRTFDTMHSIVHCKARYKYCRGSSGGGGTNLTWDKRGTKETGCQGLKLMNRTNVENTHTKCLMAFSSCRRSAGGVGLAGGWWGGGGQTKLRPVLETMKLSFGQSHT